MPHTDEIGSGLFATPVAYDATPGGPNNHYKGLGHTAKFVWPTPRANSAMSARITEKANPNRYPNLETVLLKRQPEVIGGWLNPTWVEWLMGFPEGWTDLEPSETPLSPNSQNSSEG